MAELHIDHKKCVACGTCYTICPKGAKADANGKATVIDSVILEKCGGAELCGVGAINKEED